MFAPVKLEGAGAWRQLGGSGRGGRAWGGKTSVAQPVTRPKKKKKKGKEMKRDPGQQPRAGTPSGRRGDGRPASPTLEA